jgi:D-glycero-alpha-D-manno-heptose 1-phosphate guanylyltransferase
MRAIILAGGLGTRLRGVIDDLPKPMAPVGGKPFLEYLILQLKREAITDIVLSVGYKRESIRSYFGNGDLLGVRIVYCEENEPLGTGGALKKALAMMDDPCVMVMNGDSFFNIPFSDLTAYHAVRPAIATLSLARVRDRERYGSVEINDNGAVTAFQKEGPDTQGFINGGIYAMNRTIAGYIPDGPVSLEGHVLPLLQKEDRLYGKIFDAFFLDMGLPEDYRWIDQHPEHLLSKDTP